MIDFATGAPATGSLDVAWIHGVRGEPRRGDQVKLTARGVAHRLRSRRS